MQRPLNDTDASVVCKLIVVFKKLGMMSDRDDLIFWDNLEIAMSRYGHYMNTIPTKTRYYTVTMRKVTTGLMRTLLRLGVITREAFDQLDIDLEERNRSHLVGTNPQNMPNYRVKRR